MTTQTPAPVTVGDPDSLAAAEALQARRRAYLAAGDLDGLLENCYTQDARMHSFGFRADGPQAVKEVIGLYLERVRNLGPASVDSLITGTDFVWQEVRYAGSAADVVVYEFKFLRDGKVYLQLLGEKQGSVWQPGDFAGAATPNMQAAQQLHHRYIDYQARGDADGMAEQFFSADAVLATPKIRVEGREALRAFFRQKFREESGFHLRNLLHITGDHDYLWFEGTAASSLGARTVYDAMLLRSGQVCLQLVGTLQGVLPADAYGNSDAMPATRSD